MKFSPLFFAPLLAAPFVSAHGILKRISIQDKPFDSSVIRQVSTQDPNKGANNPALTCGPNSGPAPLVADANPGDTIKFDWRTASDGPWPHNIGSMLTYMASCGSVTCDKFNQAEARWFKIDQVGKRSKDEWVQNDLMKGGVASVTIPPNVAKGNYLIRHEIIALHLATNPGGAEFYPGCAQLRIGGNGNGVPAANELVSLPGAYSDNDPGIFDPSVFDPTATYIFPGPPIATLAASQGSPSAPSPSISPLPASTAPFPTDTPQSSPPAKSKFCKKKPTPSDSQRVDDPVTLVAAPEVGGNTPTPTPTPTLTPGTGYSDYRPRRLGHIMRRMANSYH